MKSNNINGLLIFYKPKGLTSNNILIKIKKIFLPKKIGYIGTLDPIASGILLICFGKSTKLSKYLIEEKKTYKVTIKLGENTNTNDAYGFIINKNKIKFKKKKLLKIIKHYKGKINQKIPYYSACKYKGKQLYKYAIHGINIKKKKYIYIYKIKILYIKKKLIKLIIKCSKGTYIRSIINYIGKKLKCGAYILKLKRIKIGKYLLKNAIKFKHLNNNKKNNINKFIINHNKLKNIYQNNEKNSNN